MADKTASLGIDFTKETAQTGLSFRKPVPRGERDLLRDNEKLKHENVRDPLTGLFNRRYFDDQMTELTKLNKDFGLLILDIDHFKEVNDTHGHPVGDAVLIKIARELDTHVRRGKIGNSDDFVVRYGGEEMAIVFVGITDVNQIVKRAEEIRIAISDIRFRVNESVEIDRTVSIGVGQWDHKLKPDEFIKSVDAALYEAKHNGRNRVVVSK